MSDQNFESQRAVPFCAWRPIGWLWSQVRKKANASDATHLETKKKSLGFTLIELLVVMVIIGLLGALVVPRLFKNVGKSKITAAKAQISAFETALGAYKLDVGTFPSTEEGLQALRTKPASANHWDGPYLPKEIPVDPWGNPYVYKFPGEHGDEPDIISYGLDGREGGENENADVLSWK